MIRRGTGLRLDTIGEVRQRLSVPRKARMTTRSVVWSDEPYVSLGDNDGPSVLVL